MDKLFDLASRSITGAKTFSRSALSRRTVALLSVVGLAFSSLLAVIPLSAPAANHSTQVASKSSAATSQLDFREAGSVAGAAGRASGPLRAGASPSDDRFVFEDSVLVGLTDKGKAALKANKELTIPAGTTKIAEGVFSGLKLTKLTLPDSVTEVADRAFYDNQIEGLTAPGLKTIGEGAFQKNKLVTFTSDTLSTIGEGAFSDNALKSVKIKNAPVTAIPANTFRDNQLDTVELPDTVSEIGASAFANNQLKGVTLPVKLTKVGQEAFSGNQIDKVKIPATITEFGSQVFANNQRWVVLEKADGQQSLPSAVTSQKYASGFGQVAAGDAVSITINYIEQGTDKPLRSPEVLQSEFTEPDGVYFAGQKNTVKAPVLAGFAAVKEAEEITPTVGGDNTVTFVYKRTDFSPTITGEVNKHLANGADGTTAALLKDVTAKDVEGHDITNLLKVSPESVDTSVEGTTEVFYTVTDAKGRSKTVKGNIAVGPDWPEQTICPGWQVKDFTYATWTSSKGKQQAYISGFSVTGLEKYKAGKTKNSTDWCWPTVGDKGQAITAIGGSAFQRTPLTSVPDSWGNIESIGQEAFRDSKFTMVPDSWGKVETIDDEAFRDSQLTALPKSWGNVSSLGTRSFMGNKITALEAPWGKITALPRSVFQDNQIASLPASWGNIKTIGAYAFNGNKISSIPESWDNVTFIDYYAFASNSITSLPDNWGKIDIKAVKADCDAPGCLLAGAFSRNQISELKFSWDGWEEIPFSIFSSNRLTSLPDSWGTVKKIGSYAFQNNQISSLPASWREITELGNAVFSNNKLTSLPASWGEVSKLDIDVFSNNLLTSLPASWGKITRIPIYGFAFNRLTSLPDSWGDVTEIGDKAFGCYEWDKESNKITKLPASWGKITKIGERAFSGNALTLLPDSWGEVSSLGRGVFERNRLTELSAPWGKITAIPADAFVSNKLIAIPASWDNVKSIGNRAFAYNDIAALPDSWGKVNSLGSECFSLNDFAKLPDSWGEITTIPRYAFSSIPTLVSAGSDWGEVVKIDHSAFRYDKNLVKIPESWGKVSEIGPAAFGDAQALKDIPDSWGNVKTIGDIAFGGTGITKLPDYLGNFTSVKSAFRDMSLGAPVFKVADEQLEQTVQMLKNNIYDKKLVMGIKGPVYLRPESGKNPNHVASVPGKIVILVDTKVTAKYVDENGKELKPSTEQVLNTLDGGDEYNFSPPVIAGYSVPEVQKIDLDGEDKELTFVYKPVPESLKNTTYGLLELSGKLTNEPADEKGNFPSSDILKDQIGKKLRTDITYGGDAPGAELANGVIRITYDPSRVEYVESGIKDAYGFTSATVVAPGVLEIKLKENYGANRRTSIPIHWRLKERVTPSDGSYPVTATLIETADDGTRYVVKPNPASKPGPVNLQGYYLMPTFIKDAVGCSLGVCRDYDEDENGHVAETGKNAVTFTFGIKKDLFRNVKGYTITDVLPEYTKADRTTARAQFVAEENPGWTLGDDGVTLTYTDKDRIIHSEYGGLGTLKLHFPGAKKQERINNSADFTLNPEEQGANEPVITGSARTRISFYKPIETFPTGTALDKSANGPHYVNAEPTLFDTDSDRKKEINWSVYTDNTTQTAGIVNVEDYNLDKRLRYTGVTPDPFFIGGKLEILSSKDGVDKHLYSIDITDGKRIELPEDLTIYDDIWLRWVSKTEAQPGKRTISKVHTRFRDSAKKLCEQTKCEAPLANSARSGEKKKEAFINIRPEGKTIKALKRNTFEKLTLTGETGTYTVGAEIETDYGNPLTAFELVDVLPNGLEVQGVTMTGTFAALPGARYEIVSNWNNTGRQAVRFLADQVTNVDDVYNVGQLETYISKRTPGPVMVNEAFVRAQGKVIYLNKVENDPVAGAGTWSKAENTTKVSVGDETYIYKRIRKAKPNAPWTDKIQTVAGANFEYQLRLGYGNTPERNSVIYDLLPVADTQAREGSNLINQYRSGAKVTFEMADGSSVPGWKAQYTCDTNLTKETLKGATWNDEPCGAVTGLKLSTNSKQKERSEVWATVPMIAGPAGADPRSQEHLGKQAINDFSSDGDSHAGTLYSNPVINTLVPPPSNIILHKTGFKVEGFNVKEEALAGAQFGLYNPQGVLVATAISGKDGTVSFTEVDAKPGWTVRELSAPEGYQVSDKSFVLTSTHFSDKNFTDQNVYQIDLGTVKNFSRWQPIEPVTGSVEFTKVDALGRVLAGVEFTVSPVAVEEVECSTAGKMPGDKDCNPRGTGKFVKPNSAPVTVRSNDDGFVKFYGLPAGRWRLTENVGDSHLQPIEPVEFTITRCSGSECTNLRGLDLTLGMGGKVVNDKGRVSLSKLGVRGMAGKGKDFGEWQRGDGVIKPGATFNLYKGKGTSSLVRSVTTGGEAANVILDNLEINQVYTLQETKAPEGYTPN
ncbi:MAG: leucine-rich repeat protein, partial [Varibaculum cambriense]|nr:leucine-rich repeat protein [Varibaculum cambriense]